MRPRAVARHQRWLAQGSTNLKVAPYSMSAADENAIKGAIADLNTALQAISMTWIDQVSGESPNSSRIRRRSRSRGSVARLAFAVNTTS